jgi:hypothetical protein
MERFVVAEILGGAGTVYLDDERLDVDRRAVSGRYSVRSDPAWDLSLEFFSSKTSFKSCKPASQESGSKGVGNRAVSVRDFRSFSSGVDVREVIGL